MDLRDFDLLVGLHIDGRLDVDGTAQLAAALREPQWQARLRDLADLEGMLLEERGSADQLPASRSVRGWRSVVLVAAAALVLIGGGLLVWWSAREVSSIAALTGDARIIHGGTERSVANGQAIGHGDELITPAGSALTWTWHGDTTVDVEPGSRATVVDRDGVRELRLDQGGMRMHVAKGGGAKPVVITAQARIEVTGTVFIVETDPTATRVVVQEGMVLVRGPGGSAVAVPAGRQVMVAANGQPVLAAPASGLRGDYFLGKEFRVFAGTRIDPVIDADWSAQAPLPQLPHDRYCVRWTGTLTPRFTEDYTITLRVDDGARLWIDDRLVIDRWRVQGVVRQDVAIPLRAGVPHRLRLEYFQEIRQALIQLRWSSASQPSEIIPTACLQPTTGTP